jgi:Lipocalin-like domain
MRCVTVVLALVFLAAGASAQETRPAGAAPTAAKELPVRPEVRGVWKITELATRTPGEEWEVRATPHSSQFIFTDRHYSYMYVPGAGSRTLFAGDPNRPTDAEKVEAYNSVVAATGTYSLSGHSLTMMALVHKNPNEMVGKALTYTVETDGSTMRMVIANPPFQPGTERRTVLTRVE